ncbi:hypothetical protein [Paenibacillus dendritiformis]|uniref:hypothetical protein n=1 Tax=Paenibacillus dendritiformis TaxID=130049 RepID=UPI0015EC83A5|nr:hypothetical protein [Paenibacillus dendritiformis]
MNLAEKDQLFTALAETAEMAFAYYSRLLKAGFNANQALHLTSTHMTALVSRGRGDRD